MTTKATIATASVAALLLFAAYRRRQDAPVITLGALPFGFNAMTVPPVGIFVRRDQADNQRLLDHERIHWQQFQQRGLGGFYGDYLYQMAVHGYDHMPMEVEARVVEDDYCKNNYTECVRSGQARTVHNQKFISV